MREYAGVLQRRCVARLEPDGGRAYFGRCELRRGHEGPHELERGMDTVVFSTVVGSPIAPQVDLVAAAEARAAEAEMMRDAARAGTEHLLKKQAPEPLDSIADGLRRLGLNDNAHGEAIGRKLAGVMLWGSVPPAQQERWRTRAATLLWVEASRAEAERALREIAGSDYPLGHPLKVRAQAALDASPICERCLRPFSENPGHGPGFCIDRAGRDG